MRRVRFARATLRHQPSIVQIVSYVVKDGLLAGWYLRGCLVSSPRFTPRYALEKNETRACLVQVVLELVYALTTRGTAPVDVAHTVAYMIQGNVGNRSDTGPCHARVRCVSCVSRLPRCLCTGTLISIMMSSQVKSSLYINNRQPYGSLSNVLRKPAGEDGSRRR